MKISDVYSKEIWSYYTLSKLMMNSRETVVIRACRAIPKGKNTRTPNPKPLCVPKWVPKTTLQKHNT